tara:strand:- start:227 stop:1663 length:1437 start_codon:yes stop_codon:yes gene_type:complete
MELVIEDVSVYSKAQKILKKGNMIEAERLFLISTKTDNKEERFLSYLNLGKLCKATSKYDKAIHYWILGYSILNTRAETLYEITKYYREHSKHHIAYAYYKLGSVIPLPKNSLQVNKDVYNYLLDYELSIISHYLSLPIDNGFLLNNILNKCHNSNMRISLVSNYKFYTFKLSSITEKEIELSQHVLTKPEHNKNYKSTSPSILYNGAVYIVNVRYVNYHIKPNGAYTKQNGDGISIIKSNNATIVFDKEFSHMEDKVFLSQFFDNLTIRGIEDVKILYTKNNQYYFVGVVQQKENVKKGDYIIGMVFGTYDIDKDLLEFRELKSPFNKQCEKNWALFEHKGFVKFIYGWNPLTIGKLVNNKFEIIQQITDVPFMFQNLRGSSNGYFHNGEIWFVCHSVEYSTPRHYYHCFVVLDYESLSVVKYSKWFTFDGDKIEFCLGLVVEDDRIIVSHSNWDRTSKLKIIPKHEVEKLFMKTNF